MRLQNINTFLSIVPTFGKFSEEELFNADELYYALDFPQVVVCLSSISGTSAASKSGLSVFPPETKLQSTVGAFASKRGKKTLGKKAAQEMREKFKGTYVGLAAMVQQTVSLEEAKAREKPAAAPCAPCAPVLPLYQRKNPY